MKKNYPMVQIIFPGRDSLDFVEPCNRNSQSLRIYSGSGFLILLNHLKLLFLQFITQYFDL